MKAGEGVDREVSRKATAAKVNEEKRAVGRPWKRKFLGYDDVAPEATNKDSGEFGKTATGEAAGDRTARARTQLWGD